MPPGKRGIQRKEWFVRGNNSEGKPSSNHAEARFPTGGSFANFHYLYTTWKGTRWAIEKGTIVKAMAGERQHSVRNEDPYQVIKKNRPIFCKRRDVRW